MANSISFALLDAGTMPRFLSAPNTLGEELKLFGEVARSEPIIIDEIQKIPSLYCRCCQLHPWQRNLEYAQQSIRK